MKTLAIDPAAGEIERLERCIGDLVALVALPASWADAAPAHIARTALDLLERMLALDLVFVRLVHPSADSPLSMARVAPGLRLSARAHAVGAMFDVWLERTPARWPAVLRERVGDGELSLVPLAIGFQAEFGVLVAGSARPDFPSQTERLLLTVAKNQFLMTLEAARRLREQKRLTEALDRRVAHRTAELAAANEDLRASEASYRTIIDTSPECVKVIARDGTVLQLNAAGAAMGGATSPEAVIGRDFFTFLAPEDRERYREFHEQVCAGQRGFVEYSIVSLQGERRRMETHAAPLALPDGTTALIGVSRDVTSRREAEARLRRSETFLVEAQRLSLTGSFSWRFGTDRIAWSEQVYRIFELDPDVPLTLDLIRSRIHPDDVALFKDSVALARSHGVGFEYELRLLMPDRSVKHLHVVAHAAREQDGDAEYIGAVQDVTDRRRSQEALDEARAELARVSRVMSFGMLTASIAHEVNQPLAGVVTNAGTCLRMLAADPPNLDGARETLRRTIRAGLRASEVVTRLRSLFARKGGTEESVDLNEAAREVIAVTTGELRRSQVTVRDELGSDLPPVFGDRVQLQQVILNLLLNAADAMSGIVGRSRQLVIRTGQDGGGVWLSVEDAGVGFAAEDAERLFDAFYTTKPEGMGIGLSVSRSIIERHHGRMWASRNEGPGATIGFSVPAGVDTKV
jgi:PAS domain S-box-containing protein